MFCHKNIKKNVEFFCLVMYNNCKGQIFGGFYELRSFAHTY